MATHKVHCFHKSNICEMRSNILFPDTVASDKKSKKFFLQGTMSFMSTERVLFILLMVYQ